MKQEDIKTTVLKKGLSKIPDFIWILCSSYALIWATNIAVVLAARIDIDQHINKYFEIKLAEMESKKGCTTNFSEINKIEERLNQLELYSHKPKANKSK